MYFITIYIVREYSLFGKGNNLAKIAPRLCCPITINRSIRNMKGGIFWIRTFKCIALCRRHLFCIAIDIKEFETTRESSPPMLVTPLPIVTEVKPEHI